MTNLFFFIALALTLERPYFWVRKVEILRWLVAVQQVSFLCKLPENVNQSLNIEGTCVLMDLLAKRIFSNVILSPNLMNRIQLQLRFEFKKNGKI